MPRGDVRKSRRMGECIYAFTVNLNARSLSGAFLGRKADDRIADVVRHWPSRRLPLDAAILPGRSSASGAADPSRSHRCDAADRQRDSSRKGSVARTVCGLGQASRSQHGADAPESAGADGRPANRGNGPSAGRSRQKECADLGNAHARRSAQTLDPAHRQASVLFVCAIEPASRGAAMACVAVASAGLGF
jgi:hypothetical protein